MSAKRSFDLEAKRPAKRKPAARKRAAAKEPAPRRRKTLREKRQEQSTTKNLFVVAGVVVLLGLVVYGFWRPEVRISKVEAATDSLKSAALAQLSGAYYHVLPRDSFFFYPEGEIRDAVLEKHPEVSSVSVSREGFNTIALTTTERRSSMRWCGTPADAPAAHSCYEADSNGLVFRAAPAEEATTTPALRVYAELAAASSTDSYPLRAKVVGTEHMRDILRFVTDVKSLSVPVRSLSIRGDEADLYTEGNTRITYVIGTEKDARSSAEAAFPKLNLLDGSVQYVDLRFPGKVYVKRVGE